MAVALDGRRMALPAPTPVLRIPGPPFPRAVLTHLPVFGIRGKFAAVGIGTPTPLTLRFAADRLSGLKFGWLEDPLTIATPPLDHIGVVAPKRQAKNLEAFIESVLHPRRWLSNDLTTKPVEVQSFYAGADTSKD